MGFVSQRLSTVLEADIVVFFTHCGFIATISSHTFRQSSNTHRLSVVLIIYVPSITNYSTTHQCLPLHSSTLTFVNILLVSLGVTVSFYPQSLLFFVQCLHMVIFIVTQNALFQAYRLLEKLILGDHCLCGFHG